MKLEGKTVVITGASSGIGKATTARCLAEGALVVAVSDRPTELEHVAVEFASMGVIHTVVCDVSDPQQVRSLAERVAGIGGAHILLNNAGIWNERDFLEIEYENWQRLLSVNLTGPFLCSQTFAPQMIAHGGGAIVNTASTNGLVAEPRLAHYNASKGGLVMLTRSMAIDLAPYGIRVNAVAPGVIYTPLIAHILDAQPTGHFGSVPLGRIGRAEEIANCIVFLASDDASYVTGEIFVCDGGQLALNGTMPVRPQFACYPYLTPEAAEYLAGKGVCLVGLDCPSVDYEPGKTHVALLSRGTVIIENLVNLDRLPESCTLMALPLPIKAGDGCPLRAVAQVN